MNDKLDGETKARELLRRGNHYAAQKQWGNAMTMFEGAVTELGSSTPGNELRFYALAHLADASAQKLAGLYGLNQILWSAAIPALKKVDDQYHALETDPKNPNPKSPWALAHRAELHRMIANCVFDEDQRVITHTRVDHYERSIEYFCQAIEQYELQRPGTRSGGVAWACAHLGAAVVNARAFIALSCNEPLKKTTLEHICKVAQLNITRDQIDEMFEDKKAIAICLTYLRAATKLIVRALATEGFYYPWAHAYYGASLLLQGALGPHDRVYSVDIATLGQVVTSQAYYLDPGLLAGVFEPNQLSVNPPFELALIHYGYALQSKPQAALECQRAWAFGWLAAKWPFKYHFLEGLQTLTICRALAWISSTYMECVERVNDAPPPIIPLYDLLPAVGFDQQAPLVPEQLDIPMQIIHDPARLDRFIGAAFERFKAAQLEFVLQKGVALDSNLRLSLMVAFQALVDLECICTQNTIKMEIRHTLREIHHRLGRKLEPFDTHQRATADTAGQRDPRRILFSLFAHDTLSLDQILLLHKFGAHAH